MADSKSAEALVAALEKNFVHGDTAEAVELAKKLVDRAIEDRAYEFFRSRYQLQGVKSLGKLADTLDEGGKAVVAGKKAVAEKQKAAPEKPAEKSKAKAKAK